jgi:hypothetical protein
MLLTRPKYIASDVYNNSYRVWTEAKIIYRFILLLYGRKQRLNSEKFETIVKTTFQAVAKTRGKTELLALVHSVSTRRINFCRKKVLGTIPQLAIERLTGEF